MTNFTNSFLVSIKEAKIVHLILYHSQNFKKFNLPTILGKC